MSASNRDSEPTRSTPRRERQQRAETSPNTASELLDRSKQYIRDTLDLMSADEVETILGHDASHPATKVNELRVSGHLIGLPDRVGMYVYPAFQLDRHQHRIHPIVAYANCALHAADDPYGVVSWWLTATELLDGNSPLDELTAGTLTDIAVDNVLADQQSGM